MDDVVDLGAQQQHEGAGVEPDQGDGHSGQGSIRRVVVGEVAYVEAESQGHGDPGDHEEEGTRHDGPDRQLQVGRGPIEKADRAGQEHEGGDQGTQCHDEWTGLSQPESLSDVGGQDLGGNEQGEGRDDEGPRHERQHDGHHVSLPEGTPFLDPVGPVHGLDDGVHAAGREEQGDEGAEGQQARPSPLQDVTDLVADQRCGFGREGSLQHPDDAFGRILDGQVGRHEAAQRREEDGEGKQRQEEPVGQLGREPDDVVTLDLSHQAPAQRKQPGPLRLPGVPLLAVPLRGGGRTVLRHGSRSGRAPLT